MNQICEVLLLFVDILKILSVVLWKTLSGWYFGKYNWKEWFYRYVPNHVHAESILLIFSVMSFRGEASQSVKEHFEKNKRVWQETFKVYKNGIYIENQSCMIKLFYGKYAASYNACEIIAVYNVLMALSKGKSSVTFPELIATFEQSGIAADGAFGTSPKAIRVYFEKRGYNTNILTGSRINHKTLANMQSHYRVYILTSYNDKTDLGKMIHTMCITCENGKYIFHNGQDFKEYPSLFDAVDSYNEGKSKPICMIGINNF